MKLPAVGIHIYGGGFTIGAMEHFDVKYQLEEIKFGSKTFDANLGDEDIIRLLKMDEWPIKSLKRNIPYVFANPPCAPWSNASAKLGFTKDQRFFDKRLLYTKNVMNTAMAIQPDVFICESVENAYNYGISHYDPYIKQWIKLGYSVTVLLTDGIIHGLPSMRRRFHFIAHKYELKLSKPDLRNFKPVMVRDAIWDLRNKLDEVDLHSTKHRHSVGLVSPPSFWKNVPVGMTLRKTEINAGVHAKSGANSSIFVKRLAWDAPSNTIIGLSQLIHPDGERMLTWRESLRLLSFPDWFTTHSDKEGSDTVTPLMARFLSNTAKKTIKAAIKIKIPTYNVVDWRIFGIQFQIGTLRKSNLYLV